MREQGDLGGPMVELLDRPALPPEAPRTRLGRVPDWLPLVTVAAAVLTLEPLVIWGSQVAHPLPVVHDTALFFHLAALLLGFGAVLTVDWVAAMYLLGRRSFLDMVQAADNAAVPIWAGYAGLVLSGLLLEPALDSPLTLVKLGLVLVIGLNGVVALAVHRALSREPDLRWMAIGGSVAVVSQIGWWGATMIGFLNAH